MASVDRSTATLRMLGNDLDPDEITRLLGTAPTGAARRGEQILSSLKRIHIAQTGRWALRVRELSPGNLDAQIREILARTTGDLAIWRGLSRRFECRVVCGLFLRTGNEGAAIAPDLLAMLGERRLHLDLDLYAANSPEDPDARDGTRH
ncbi:DUF4279 domain-containing protein [Methylobacterium oryzihabitans]|uniref:DUF4279 domain-containing protein n=1 Tax=Methylobacterium oryzihabitans TaxID=2499852 RepID=A0A437NR28_9HYPH|nr:DUF4279 domain-containing protein [Methylobacterium oryzihabitans]RVU12492.1 DUF4279 domain-containing protein [Methylobacterium oryzihabitans]